MSQLSLRKLKNKMAVFACKCYSEVYMHLTIFICWLAILSQVERVIVPCSSFSFLLSVLFFFNKSNIELGFLIPSFVHCINVYTLMPPHNIMNLQDLGDSLILTKHFQFLV